MAGIEGKPTGLSGVTKKDFPEVFTKLESEKLKAEGLWEKGSVVEGDITHIKPSNGTYSEENAKRIYGSAAEGSKRNQLKKMGQLESQGVEKPQNTNKENMEKITQNETPYGNQAEKAVDPQNSNENSAHVSNVGNPTINFSPVIENNSVHNTEIRTGMGSSPAEIEGWDAERAEKEMERILAGKDATDVIQNPKQDNVQESNKVDSDPASIIPRAHKNDVMNMEDWKNLKDQEKSRGEAMVKAVENDVQNPEDWKSLQEKEKKLSEKAEAFQQRRILRREMHAAKDEFEAAYLKEMEGRNKGFFKGKINRLRDKFSSSAFEISDETKTLRDKWLGLQSRRSDAILDMATKYDTPEEKERKTSRVHKALNGQALRDFNEELLLRSKADNEFKRAEAKKKSENPKNLSAEKIKEMTPKQIKGLAKWYMRQNMATKAALGGLLIGGIAVGSGAGLAALTIGGAAAGRKFLVGSTILGGAAAFVKGSDMVETNKSVGINEKYTALFQKLDPGDMAGRQDLFRKRMSELDENQKNFAKAKIGIAALALAGAGVYAADQILDHTTGAGIGDRIKDATSTEWMDDLVNPEVPTFDAPLEAGAGIPSEDPSHEKSFGSNIQPEDSAEAVSTGPSLELRSVTEGEGGLSYMKYIRETIRADLGISVDDPVPADAPEAYKELLEGSLNESAKKFGFFDPTGVGNTGEESFRFNFDANNPENNGRLVIENGNVRLLNGDDSYSLFRPDAGVTSGDLDGDMIDSNFDKRTYGQPSPTEKLPYGQEPGDVVDGKYYYQDENGEYKRFADANGDPNNLTRAQVLGEPTATPSYTAIEDLEGADPNIEYIVPTQDHIDQGLAFERDGRHYYYNHEGYPIGNPFGEELSGGENTMTPEQVTTQSAEFTSAKEMLMRSSVAESGVLALENHSLDMSQFEIGKLGLTTSEFGSIETNTAKLPGGKTIAVHGFSKGDMNLVMKVLPNEFGQETIYVHNGDNPIPMETYGGTDSRISFIKGLNYIKENLIR